MRFLSIFSIIALSVILTSRNTQAEETKTVKDAGEELSSNESVSSTVPPELIFQETPSYPLKAKRSGDTGTVLLIICVGVQGDVTKAELAKPSGSRSLDRAALRAAYKNKFKPATQKGQPVKCWVQFPVKFSLSDVVKRSADHSGEIDVDSKDCQVAFGEFIPVEADPEMVHEALPKYPQEAKKAGITGKVLVSALVDEQGVVGDAKVVESSGSELLDQAALDAAHKNKYKPGMHGGRPVKTWTTFPVEFTIAEEDKPSSGGEIEAKSDSGDSLPAPVESLTVEIHPDSEMIEEQTPTDSTLADLNKPLSGSEIEAKSDSGDSLPALVESLTVEVYPDSEMIEEQTPTDSTLVDVNKPSSGSEIETKSDSDDSLPAPVESLTVEVYPDSEMIEEHTSTDSTLVDVNKPSSGGEIEAKSDSDDSLPAPVESLTVEVYPDSEMIEEHTPTDSTLVDVNKPSSGGETETKSDSGDYLPDPDELISLEVQPEMIYQHTPDYPPLAKQAGITGTVLVKALLNEEGNVIDAIVGESSGTKSLDDAALKAAFKNKFKPGIQNGRPVKAWITYPVEFVIDE